MSFVKEVSSWITSGINGIIQGADNDQLEKMIEIILECHPNKILVIGSGRSGFVGRAFALRLMQSGFNVYVSGDTIAPALSPGDLVIAISGSGTTKIVVAQAEIANEIGARIISVTSHQGSALVRLSELAVIIKGRTKDSVDIDFTRRQITGEYDMAPLGTMFELSVLILLDSIIAALMKRQGQNEVDLKKRHAHTQ
ncbi:MAG: SIS domain-containing protein [Candidatus Bathyarchaeota archaeon]|nr:SIS domain-containing protein [Candidatus Bathyarchaeota archaeon]